MYAIIATGGKQYRVSEGDVIYIEKIDAAVDSTVSFDVLLVGNEGDVKVGTPVVEGVKVEGKVVAHGGTNAQVGVADCHSVGKRCFVVDIHLSNHRRFVVVDVARQLAVEGQSLIESVCHIAVLAYCCDHHRDNGGSA